MNDTFVKNPFDHMINLQYERVSETNVKVTMPVQSIFINSIGVVNGGIISFLADMTMGNIHKVGENNKQAVVTVDLKVTFLKGAKGDYLTADAHLVKRGKTLSHVDCYIYNDHNDLVAKANGIFINF